MAIKRIARLENYFMGMEKDDFREDIINMQKAKDKKNLIIAKPNAAEDALTELNENVSTIT